MRERERRGDMVGRALLASVRAPVTPADATLVAALEACDAVELLQAVKRHGLGPRLHVQAGEALVEGLLAQVLRVRWERQAVREMTVLGDLRWLSTVMGGAGIRWCVVKGPVLAATVYERSDVREYSDLDVLVDRRQLVQALEVLEQAGAGLQDRNWPLIGSSRRGELTLVLPGGTTLDLHWHLITEERVRAQFDYEMQPLLERLREVELPGGLRVPALDREDALQHLCAHAVLSGGQKLSWWQDVALSTSAWPVDGAVLAGRARRAGMAVVCALMIERSCDALAMPRPDPLLRRLGERSGWGRAVRVFDRRRPAWTVGDGALTGQTLLRSTRADAAQSTVALLSATSAALLSVMRNPEHPWRHHVSGTGTHEHNPLHLPVGTPADRDAALRHLTGTAS